MTLRNACGAATLFVLAAALLPNAVAEDDSASVAEVERVERELAATREEIHKLTKRLAKLSMEVAGEEVGHFFEMEVPEGEDRAMIGVALVSRDDDPVARIAAVTPGGPADKAGLQTGDVIIAVNGERVGNDNQGLEVADMLDALSPGDSVNITAERDGQAIEKTVVAEVLDRSEMFAFNFNGHEIDLSALEGLEALKGMEGLAGLAGLRGLEALEALKGLEGLEGLAALEGLQALEGLEGLEALENLDVNFAFGGDWPDFEVVALTPELGDYFGVSEGLLLVRAPTQDGLDLRDGDVVVEIDGNPVADERDLWRAMREHAKDQTVPVKIVRQRQSLTLDVSVPDRTGPGTKVFIHRMDRDD